MKNNIYMHCVQPEDIDYTGHSSIPALYRKIINAVSMNIRGADIWASVQEVGERQMDFCLRQDGNVACLASLSI